MQKVTPLVALADFDSSDMAVSALARACELLEAGNLADAAKWAAVAADSGEGETRPETA